MFATFYSPKTDRMHTTNTVLRLATHNNIHSYSRKTQATITHKATMYCAEIRSLYYFVGLRFVGLRSGLRRLPAVRTMRPARLSKPGSPLSFMN